MSPEEELLKNTTVGEQPKRRGRPASALGRAAREYEKAQVKVAGLEARRQAVIEKLAGLEAQMEDAVEERDTAKSVLESALG